MERREDAWRKYRQRDQNDVRYRLENRGENLSHQGYEGYEHGAWSLFFFLLFLPIDWTKHETETVMEG